MVDVLQMTYVLFTFLSLQVLAKLSSPKPSLLPGW